LWGKRKEECNDFVAAGCVGLVHETVAHC